MSGSDCKPVVTWAGDATVFSSLEAGLKSGLPNEAVEWKRSYGRQSRQVYIEAEFVPFSAETVVGGGEVGLQGQPVFHTFWTAVVDTEQYRTNVKEEVSAWLGQLRRGGVQDWLLVLVETPDTRKGNKFPLRTSVLDKLKQDVAGKSPERVLALLDPGKADSRAAESMQSLLHKFRQFFLLSYNKVLNKFEERMRSQREKRTEAGWDFCRYLLLQEELALVYETLGLPDEALVQYDELDALLTQFVLNCSVGAVPGWVERLSREAEDWSPLSLEPAEAARLRGLLAASPARPPSLLNLRNYLFSRQCSLLLRSKKPADAAARTLPFVQNTVQELGILQTGQEEEEGGEGAGEGSLDSWVLLACLCVLQAVGGADTTRVTADTAALWSAAREKLLGLGELCGLMPGGSPPSSQQLHTVVSLTGGLPDWGQDSPPARLKLSLTSSTEFQRSYLELCETAISSYKHIGRLRSARQTGLALAKFYLLQAEHEKAAKFLAEALKSFQAEGWEELSLVSLLELAGCHAATGEVERLVRVCSQVAGSQAASPAQRAQHWDLAQSSLQSLPSAPLALAAQPSLVLLSCRALGEQEVRPGAVVKYQLQLHSALPGPAPCQLLQLAMAHTEPGDRVGQPGRGRPVSRTPSTVSTASTVSNAGDEAGTGGQEGEAVTGDLEVGPQLDYKQDGSLCAARLVCRNSGQLLRRKDSSGLLAADCPARADYTECLEAGELVLQPGENWVEVRGRVGREGEYRPCQLSARLAQLDLLQGCPSLAGPAVKVVTRPAVVSLVRLPNTELYAGLESQLSLRVEAGSCEIPPGTQVTLTCLRGLKVRCEEEELAATAQVELPPARPGQTVETRVWLLAELTNQYDGATLEHRMRVENPWDKQEKDVFLHFLPAFYSTFQLLTAMERKFVQVLVFPLLPGTLTLATPSLSLDAAALKAGLQLAPVNPEGSEMDVRAGWEGGLLWELLLPAGLQEDRPARLELGLQYRAGGQTGQYSAQHVLQHYTTLYRLRARVEPARGSEFCRAGTVCGLAVQLEQCGPASPHSIYYEVIAEQAVWAVCGRQCAVLSTADMASQTITVEVMPLVGGQLALPAIRLSKYIPADTGSAKLDPFHSGQVYNLSKSTQVHVLPPLNQQQEFVSLP